MDKSGERPGISAELKGLISRIGDAVVSIVYPAACRVCGAPVGSLRDGVACGGCWAEFDTAPGGAASCRKCGVLLPERTQRLSEEARNCGRCGELDFDLARACGPYRGALRESVLELKKRPHFPARLRSRTIETCRLITELSPVDSIIPVPLHQDRQAERSYNQAELITRAIAVETGLPVDVSSLVRVRATTRHRAGMSPIERSRSLKNAFSVRAPRLVRDRSLLIVDDVMTTGSTAHEISLALRAAGARNICVLTLARAVIYGY